MIWCGQCKNPEWAFYLQIFTRILRQDQYCPLSVSSGNVLTSLSKTVHFVQSFQFLLTGHGDKVIGRFSASSASLSSFSFFFSPSHLPVAREERVRGRRGKRASFRAASRRFGVLREHGLALPQLICESDLQLHALDAFYLGQQGTEMAESWTLFKSL